MKASRWIVPVLLLGAIGAYWSFRPRAEAAPEAYVSERLATLWSSTAQVRESVATLHYGERVETLARRGEQTHVRTAQGVTGWIESRLLMDPALWQRSMQLLIQARSLLVQARGHTKVPTNVRAEPGRAAARLYQFGRGVPVEVFSRAVVDLPAAEEKQAAESAGKAPRDDDQRPRREDWFFVRGMASSAAGPASEGFAPTSDTTGIGDGSVEVAGWVLARFVESELPGPVRDYASSTASRAVAALELNRVPDREGGEKAQYLVAGVRGSEGQPCDFTTIRVYTWGSKRKRYETAYIEGHLCGRLPIRTGRNASGDPEFRFVAIGGAGNEERRYQMRQTVVRRIRERDASLAKPRR